MHAVRTYQHWWPRRRRRSTTSDTVRIVSRRSAVAARALARCSLCLRRRRHRRRPTPMLTLRRQRRQRRSRRAGQAVVARSVATKSTAQIKNTQHRRHDQLTPASSLVVSCRVALRAAVGGVGVDALDCGVSTSLASAGIDLYRRGPVSVAPVALLPPPPATPAPLPTVASLHCTTVSRTNTHACMHTTSTILTARRRALMISVCQRVKQRSTTHHSPVC